MAAHTLKGDDVIAAVDHCTGNVTELVEGGFKMLFGVAPTDWHRATDEQRDRIYSSMNP